MRLLKALFVVLVVLLAAAAIVVWTLPAGPSGTAMPTA